MYMEWYNGTYDIFFGIENKLRREEMEETFNKEAKQGWRLVADAAIFTDENAGSVDCKHTSGGVSLAIESGFGVVVKKKKQPSRFFLDMRDDSLKHG